MMTTSVSLSLVATGLHPCLRSRLAGASARQARLRIRIVYASARQALLASPGRRFREHVGFVGRFVIRFERVLFELLLLAYSRLERL